METIGVVGPGRMGLPIVAKLGAAGFDVSAFDLRTAAMDAAREFGARPESAAGALASRVDVLVTVLPGGDELSGAMFGSEGMLADMSRGSWWLDLTSADPGVVGDIAAVAVAAGVEWVGAPMGGGPDSAASGALRFFVGGKPHAVQRARPILESIGGSDSLTVMGADIRAGYTAKLLANTLWFTQAVAVTEALLLGPAAGLDLRLLRDALATSAGGSVFLATFGIDRVVEELDAVTALASALATPGDLTAYVASLHLEQRRITRQAVPCWTTTEPTGREQPCEGVHHGYAFGTRSPALERCRPQQGVLRRPGRLPPRSRRATG